VRVALKRQSLTAPARAGSSIRVGRGEEMDLPKSNKEIWDSIQMKRRVPLDKNNPIQGFRMPAFGCRPIATRRHTLGPASEILQRKNPREMAGDRFRGCYGDLWVAPAGSVTSCEMVVRPSGLPRGRRIAALRAERCEARPDPQRVEKRAAGPRRREA
jgi:hypothetical protein